MGKKLTAEQVDGYWRDGFVSPVDVMSREDAGALRRRVEDNEAQFGAVHYMVKP